MPGPLDTPVPQRLVRLVARHGVHVLCVAQLPLQHGRSCIVRAQRRMPLSASALVATAKREYSLPFRGMPFQRGNVFGHRGGRPPLTPARVGQRTEPAAHPQTAHSREQLPKIRLLRGATHHAGRSPAHKPCSCARVSAHGQHWSYG